MTNATNEKRNAYDTIRKGLNDVFLNENANEKDLVIFTASVSALPIEKFNTLMNLFANFNDYNEDNDPYGEHDFTVVKMEGETYFAKFDDYRNTGENKRFVLTILNANEY